MHAVVSKRDLGRILARCQGVADKKSTMPVLANVLLAVAGAERDSASPRPTCTWRQWPHPRQDREAGIASPFARRTCSSA